MGQIVPFGFMKGGGFSPANIDSLVLWLDASDSTTITHASQRVSSWADKSGGGRNAANVGSDTQPQLQYNIQNGKPALYFSAARGDKLTRDGMSGLVSAKLTFFAVVALNSGSASFGRVFAITDGGGADFSAVPRGCIILRSGTSEGFAAYRVSQLSTLSVTYDQMAVITSKFDGTNHTIYRNGTGGTPAGSVGEFNPTQYAIGVAISASGSFQGYVCELIWYKGSLSDVDRLAVEAYLKAKWATP
jgi:hypothetical protein